MAVFGEFWIDQNPKITRFLSVTRFGCEFSPKMADFCVFGQYLVILTLNHLATLRKWPKSQNYQIWQCYQIWMWIFTKIADFGIFDRFLTKNPPELSGDAVSTEHQIHWKGVIFGLDNLAFGLIPDISLKKSIHIEQLLYMYIILCCYLNIIVFPTT